MTTCRFSSRIGLHATIPHPLHFLHLYCSTSSDTRTNPCSPCKILQGRTHNNFTGKQLKPSSSMSMPKPKNPFQPIHTKMSLFVPSCGSTKACSQSNSGLRNVSAMPAPMLHSSATIATPLKHSPKMLLAMQNSHRKAQIGDNSPGHSVVQHTHMVFSSRQRQSVVLLRRDCSVPHALCKAMTLCTQAHSIIALVMPHPCRMKTCWVSMQHTYPPSSATPLAMDNSPQRYIPNEGPRFSRTQYILCDGRTYTAKCSHQKALHVPASAFPLRAPTLKCNADKEQTLAEVGEIHLP